MKIKENRTKIAGLLSGIFHLAGSILIARNFLLFMAEIDENETWSFELGAIFLAITFVFALVGMIKPQKSETGKTLCLVGIILPLIFASLFLIAPLVAKSINHHTDEYLYDREKHKIGYILGDGFFDYSRTDIYRGDGIKGAGGNFFYDVYMGGTGKNDKFSYCDWLCLDNGARMIGLNYFCDFYDISREDDKTNRRTIIHELSDRLIIPWGSYQAYYEKSKETFDLKYPVVRRKTGDTHVSEDGEDTFIDTDLLYYAGFLRLYDEEACKKYSDYLYGKWSIIENEGEHIDGQYFYKGNRISGAAMDFFNNELFEDAVIKIGMSTDEVIKVFGPSCKTFVENMLAYPWFVFYFDENNKIKQVHICFD